MNDDRRVGSLRNDVAIHLRVAHNETSPPHNTLILNHNPYMSHIIAVPSWVTAGSIVENAAFILAQDSKNPHPVTEIGLCFFETASCLAYTDSDLPPHLADLPFTWHVHLPSDLPWHEGGAAVAHIALKLMDKVAFLGAKKAVLHPPLLNDGNGGKADIFEAKNDTHDATLLREFMTPWCAAGRAPHDVHIENIHGHDLVSLWATIAELGCKVCLDTGHLITYKQDALRDVLLGRGGACEQGGAGNCEQGESDIVGAKDAYASLMQHIGMMHLCATAPSGRHAPLTAFTAEEQDLVATLCRAVPTDCTLMLELFKWDHVAASLPLVQGFISNDTNL